MCDEHRRNLIMAFLLEKFMNLGGFLIGTIRTVKNWFSVILLRIGFRKNIVVVFRNGIKVEIPDRSRLNTILHLIKIQLCSPILQVPNGTCKIVLGNAKVFFQLTDEDSITRAYILSRLHKELNMKLYPEHDYCEFYVEGKKVVFFFGSNDNTGIECLFAAFINDAYGALNVRGKVVADIGASYGDTALYFALKGARKVYAYEPVPWVAEILEKNVRLNNLSNVVKVYPYAVSFNEGEAMLTVPERYSMRGSLYYDDVFKFNKKVEVKQVRVQKVTPPQDAEVAKIDCEGCENDIILKWLKNRIYEELIVEYHGNHRQLVKKLGELGYKVEFLDFSSERDFGTLYAYNKR
jgi:FkbM family methyltransferase